MSPLTSEGYNTVMNAGLGFYNTSIRCLKNSKTSLKFVLWCREPECFCIFYKFLGFSEVFGLFEIFLSKLVIFHGITIQYKRVYEYNILNRVLTNNNLITFFDGNLNYTAYGKGGSRNLIGVEGGCIPIIFRKSIQIAIWILRYGLWAGGC